VKASRLMSSHTEEYTDFTVITVCNRPVTGSRSFCMQRNAVFCYALCRVQSAISQCFDCFFYYRWLELNDPITHGFERALPTHKVPVRPDFPRSPDESNQPFYHRNALLSQAAYKQLAITKYKSNYQQLGYEVDNELSQPSRTVFYNKSKTKAVIAYDGMSMLTRMLTTPFGRGPSPQDLPAQMPDSKKKDHSPWACTQPLT